MVACALYSYFCVTLICIETTKLPKIESNAYHHMEDACLWLSTECKPGTRLECLGEEKNAVLFQTFCCEQTDKRGEHKQKKIVFSVTSRFYPVIMGVLKF